MFWSAKSSNKIVMLDTALQRLADGLPLPLETASWPEPLNTTVPELAKRLTLLREHLDALAQGQAELALLPESSGLAGLTTSVNALQRKIQKNSNTLTQLESWFENIETGNLTYRIDEQDTLNNKILRQINQLTDQLHSQQALQEQQIQEAAYTESLANVLRGELTVEELGEHLLSELCTTTVALTGTFYLYSSNGIYQRYASYGFSQRHTFNQDVVVGEGLLGQAIRDDKLTVLDEVPEGYLPIESSMALGKPRKLLLWPISLFGKPLGAVELGSVSEFSPWQLAWMRRVEENIAIAISTSQARDKMAILLNESETKNEELKSQKEELRVQGETMLQLNSNLAEKNESAMRLQAELEEKNELLNRQQAVLEEHNEALERQKAELHQRRAEVERASRYKSEFLANMSHELRTPLNSLLLLSGLLIDNEDNNLTEDQLESLAMIQKGGQDLLTLINDILDLSKIEAGQLKVIKEHVEPIAQIQDLADLLAPLAEHKGIELTVNAATDTPNQIHSDSQRIAQIIKNLISNAIKFTEQGGVSINLSAITQPIKLPNNTTLTDGLRIEVKDSGLGIAPERHDEVFEAFQQGDGSITRKYGGTGLGLAISRQLARRLGGDITLESTLGQGASFFLLLPYNGLNDADTPVDATPPKREKAAAPQPAQAPVNEPVSAPKLVMPSDNPLDDDRESCAPNERCLLLIEDDVAFARTVLKHIRKKDYKALAATNGTDGLALAAIFKPEGIVLDLGLPDLDGREVIEALKNNPITHDIPVHIVSSRDKDLSLLSLGAVDVIQKPVNTHTLKVLLDNLTTVCNGEPGRLLVVEDDEATRVTLSKALAKQAVLLTFATTGAEALALLNEQVFDGMLLDLGLPDMNGQDILDELENRKIHIPVIVHTGRELSESEYQALRDYSDSIVLKGSEGGKRLLDEVALFVHNIQIQANKPQSKSVVAKPTSDNSVLQNKKVLLVDDDMRNAFAMNKILRKYELVVVLADDGQLALDKLAEQPDIDIVLMDIMMPIMDGYEAMQRMRQDSRFSDIPVIALTAKAMNEDREKCINAGADDYLTKPVDIDKLLSLLHLYLTQGRS